MSLTIEAIKHIQQSQTAQAVQDAVNTNTVQSQLVAVPSDITLQSLEKYQQHRDRFRGEMNTSSIVEFIDYVKGHGETNQQCFINEESMAAVNIFNFGSIHTPGHCDDKAIVTLKKTAEYKALCQINGETVSQKAAAEFLEDWGTFITCIDENGEVINPAKAIAAVRRITIEASRKSESEQGNFRTEKSALESMSVDTNAGLPATVRFKCVPYAGLTEYEFDLRVSVLTSSEVPKIVMRIKRFETYPEQFAQEFSALLKSGFDSYEKAPAISIGTFKAA
jgi:uncharacterized protein YfdQ (DUF2303 family)